MSHRITMSCVEQNPHSGKHEVSLTVDKQAAHIDDFCDAFRAFLIASGYHEVTAAETADHIKKGFENG